MTCRSEVYVAQVPLAEDNDMIKTFPSNRANQPFGMSIRRCHVVEIWMQVRRVPQLRSRRGNDFTPRLHGRRPEGSVCSC
jgi:hypothetical protein